MNAEQFYEDFKAALSYLGLRWGDMGLAQVHLTQTGCVVLVHGGKAASFEVPKL